LTKPARAARRPHAVPDGAGLVRRLVLRHSGADSRGVKPPRGVVARPRTLRPIPPQRPRAVKDNAQRCHATGEMSPLNATGKTTPPRRILGPPTPKEATHEPSGGDTQLVSGPTLPNLPSPPRRATDHRRGRSRPRPLTTPSPTPQTPSPGRRPPSPYPRQHRASSGQQNTRRATTTGPRPRHHHLCPLQLLPPRRHPR